MELAEYLRMLRRGWLTILGATVIGTLLGLAYLRATPEVFQARAALFASPRDPQNIGDLQVGTQFAAQSATTVVTLMTSAAVLDPVAADLARDGVLLDEEGGPVSAASLSGSVSISAPPSTSVIYVSGFAGSPELAARLANAVAAGGVQSIPALVSSDPRQANAPLLDLTVVQEAVPSAAPISPNRNRILTLLTVIGLAIGLALTVTRQSLDTRLRRPADVRAATPTGILGVIPRQRRSKHAPIVVRDSTVSPAVEAYRVLRTNLGRPTSGSRLSIAFATVNADSLAPRVPINVAWSMAQTDRRTLLVDLDLRSSHVGDLLGLEPGDGASELLSGARSLREVVRPTKHSSLDVVTSGSRSRTPADLLSGAAFERAILEAEESYDVVVLNVPPLLSYTDAAVVARVATQTVLTIRADRTRRPDLAAAVDVLANVEIEPVGVVLFDSRTSALELAKLRDRGRARETGTRSRGSRRLSSTAVAPETSG